MTVGSHYLRRFSVLNLDSLSYDFKNDDEDHENIEYLINHYKDKYERIFILAQRENCDFAIDLAKNLGAKALILQGMTFDENSIQRAKDLKAHVLMASCGLDYSEDKIMTQKLQKVLRNARSYIIQNMNTKESMITKTKKWYF